MANKPHLFQPGVSGNPSGRPKNGSWKDRVQTACNQVFTPETCVEIMEVLAKKAKSGHTVALKLFAERALPAILNDRYHKVDLRAKTLKEKADCVKRWRMVI